MAGSGYQSADLLNLFNQMTGRPSGDVIADSVKYQYLADAQQQLANDLMVVAPQAFPNAITTMSTADGGYTFTFGTDNDGYPLFPLAAAIYQDLSSIPSSPWIPGIDYLDEGTTIRMPNNTPWTGDLYCYGVTMPQRMSASVQPALQHPQARYCIPLLAGSRFAEDGLVNGALSDRLFGRYQERYGHLCTTIRKHLRGGRPLAPLIAPNGYGGWPSPLGLSVFGGV